METKIERIEQDMEVINTFNTTPGEGITLFSFTKEWNCQRKGTRGSQCGLVSRRIEEGIA